MLMDDVEEKYMDDISADTQQYKIIFKKIILNNIIKKTNPAGNK